MFICFFVSDLHGNLRHYEKLFKVIEEEIPKAVFLGGDLLPSGLYALNSQHAKSEHFLNKIFLKGFAELKKKLGKNYPKIFLILGNDDGKSDEEFFKRMEKEGLWYYMHSKNKSFYEFNVFGYSYVPPTPFQLKDWERYDVSRFVDPGCISPEEGWHTVMVPENVLKYSNIKEDLQNLVDKNKISKTIFLFHSPPYNTFLDRVANDGKFIDHIPLDLHAGSIAIRRFIEQEQPLITLHGHIHESARITGKWKDRIGKTFLYSAAHDGPEFALVRFDPHYPEKATRELL